MSRPPAPPRPTCRYPGCMNLRRYSRWDYANPYCAEHMRPWTLTEALEWALDIIAAELEVIGPPIEGKQQNYDLNGVKMAHATTFAHSLERARQSLAASASDEGSLDAAWAEAEAALPLAGWMSKDGRWALPSGSWIIGIEYRPESGDGYYEPYYAAAYFARAQVRGPEEKWFTGDDANSPAAALRVLAAHLRATLSHSEPETGK